jgi:heat shock protein HtpX
MAFMKRIMLFMAVNLLVVVTISIVLNVLGVRPYMTAHGIDMQSLAVFCLGVGHGGVPYFPRTFPRDGQNDDGRESD